MVDATVSKRNTSAVLSFERFPEPGIVLGQHVMLGRSGDVAGSAGPITSAANSL